MLKTSNLCRYRSILKEVELRSSYFEVVKFIHESRDSNYDAHYIVRNYISREFGRRVWLVDPPDNVSMFEIVE